LVTRLDVKYKRIRVVDVYMFVCIDMTNIFINDKLGNIHTENKTIWSSKKSIAYKGREIER